MRAISRPPSTTAMSPSSVTRPMTATGRPHRVQTSRTTSDRSGRTIASIRSCDSEISTSNGSRSGSRRGTASRSIRIPVPARSAVSDVAQVMPPAPRSWRPSTRPRSISSREASISSFSANGSPTCTEGRLDGSSSEKVAEASTDAPPIPSRPVVDPNRTARLPGPGAAARVSCRSSSSPIAITLTSGLPWYDSSNTSSPPIVGTPTQLPYPPTPLTTPSTRWRVRAEPGSPKRSASSTAIGRAPIVKMSRRIPPTPVAAPWYGSTALGWLCDSILNATARPSPIEITPAFSPGPATTPAPVVGRVDSKGFELLYEQCSLHMTLNIASSRSFGSRPPRRSRIASSSSSVSPSRRWSGSM